MKVGSIHEIINHCPCVIPNTFRDNSTEIGGSMDVVILCGGKGTRLSEETIKKPKPMVEIGNMPILWHIMKIYSYYGFNRFILALGYKGEQIKQYFYNADAYEHFMDLCAKKNVKIPVVPGIMPITNYSRLARFSQMCGAEIPRWLEKQLMAYGDDTKSIRQLGEEAVTRLVEKLIGLGAPSFHFYTLNQAEPSLAICRNLKLGAFD